MPTLLFLCTGNYYRSPFAEHLFNALARPLSLPWGAASRGLAIERGVNNVGPISTMTLAALATRGVVVAPPIRFPAQAQDHDFAGAQRIIALHEHEHRPLVAQRFPAWADHVEYWHVPDVGELSADRALDAIAGKVVGLIEELRGS